MKLHFAQRVKIALTAKSDSSNMYAQERAKVQAEVNAHPVKIDRSIFVKTEREKNELKIEKIHWKAKQRALK